MKPNNDEIRQANRKALPKFFLILIVSCLVGGVIGFCGAWFGLEGITGGLAAAGTFFSTRVAHWLLLACAVVIPAVSLPLYFSAKQELARWDGEEEALYARADSRLSCAILINSTLLILSMFLIAVSYSNGFVGMGLGGLIALVGFVAVLVETILIQQKMVDLAKRINPEKQGSVYDVKFQKKWLDSCDEAEKMLIGQCAYKAYSAVNITCLVLWMLFALSALFLSTGFLPALAVCVIWGVSQWVFCRQSMKLSAPSGAVL